MSDATGGPAARRRSSANPQLVRNLKAAVSSLTHERIDQRAEGAEWFCFGLSKSDALARLPLKEGAFVVRENKDHFGTLSVVVGDQLYNAHIIEEPEGLRLKNGSVHQQNLSALIAYYKLPAQQDLPRCLVAW